MTAYSQRRNALIWNLLGMAGVGGILAAFLGVHPDLTGPLLFVGIPIAITGFIVARSYSRRAKVLDNLLVRDHILAEWELPNDNGKAIITLDGMIIYGEIYPFKDFSCTLEKLEIQPHERMPNKLVFHVIFPGQRSDARLKLEVPIPEGESEKAVTVWKRLRERFSV
jgi:hypothetical protein